MLIFVILIVVAYFNKEKILAEVMKARMTGRHRLECAKREAYKKLYENGLL